MQKEKVIWAGAAAAGLGALYWAYTKVSQMLSHSAMKSALPAKVPLNPVTHSVQTIAALNSVMPASSTLGSGVSKGTPRTPSPSAPAPLPINVGSFDVVLGDITVSPNPDYSGLAASAPGGNPPATVTTVRDVQRALNYLGIANPPLAEDNVAGPLTKAAVRTYQAANGLTVDGIAGPQTKASLYAAIQA